MVDTATVQIFIEPVDMLALRGNQLFGEPGSFGRSMVPPWPSVAAGALRSALLAHRRYDFGAFARGEVEDAELGTPQLPGTFTITAFQIARRHLDSTVEPLYGVPADLSVANAEHGELQVRRIVPHGGIAVCTSSATRQLPVLGAPHRAKPVGECLITARGWRRYLAGEDLGPRAHRRKCRTVAFGVTGWHRTGFSHAHGRRRRGCSLRRASCSARENTAEAARRLGGMVDSWRK